MNEIQYFYIASIIFNNIAILIWLWSMRTKRYDAGLTGWIFYTAAMICLILGAITA